MTDKFEEMTESFDRLARLMMDRCEQLQEQINMYSGNNNRHFDHHNTLSYSGSIEALEPIRELMEDPSINDILINGIDGVYIERHGKLKYTDIKFSSEEALWNAAKEIAMRCGRYLDADRPVIDARLEDGSRVNIIAPPLSMNGTVISIRKFAGKAISLDYLADVGSMNQQMADFLKVCAATRSNILIVGGTGAGKTTLLNAISQFVPVDQRVVTIEDSAELKLMIPHVVRLEAKPHVHGTPQYTEVTIRDLVKNALRMRPDRVIVGETRGAEAFDMIQAMNTGHEGSMTTIHANSVREGLTRLENMVGMANSNLTLKAIRHMISTAVNIIVRINRMRDGTRIVTHISEITGMEGETIVSQDIFEFKEKNEDQQDKVIGEFVSTGIMPRMMKTALKTGYKEHMNKIFNYRSVVGLR